VNTGKTGAQSPALGTGLFPGRFSGTILAAARYPKIVQLLSGLDGRS
jgi:hypothetical protein